MQARCLVTGAAGFIGGHLAVRLSHLGYNVVGFDKAWAGTENRAFGRAANETRVDGDILDLAALRQAATDVDFIFHQAALVSLQASFETPLETFSTNALGTANVLEAARQTPRVKRVVLASSSAVDIETAQSHAPEAVSSPYALSKLINEYWGSAYTKAYAVPTVMLRYYNVFGPRQKIDGAYAAVIPAFIKAAVHHVRPTIFGDGCQTRDFVYIDNIVNANIAAVVAGGAAGRVLPVASGSSWSVNRLWRTIACMADVTHLTPVHEAAKPGEVRYSVADISESAALLGPFRTIDVETGLRATLHYYDALFKHSLTGDGAIPDSP